MIKDYLIIAHPRSGTGYMANLFKLNGFDIGHEVMGEHGTSNWQFAVKSDFYPFDVDGIKRQHVKFNNVIHVMREPLDAICSIALTEGRSELFRAEYVPIIGNDFERAVMSYYGWNMLIKSQQPNVSLKLCDAKKVFSFEHDSPIVNQRQHETLSENELLNYLSDGVKWYYYKTLEFYSKL